MRKSFIPRFFLLILLYCGIFIVLVSVQFARRGGFTQRVGNFVVSGQYRLPGENDPPKQPNEYLLDGDVHVFFGGIDFEITGGNDDRSFLLIENDELKTDVLPERMLIDGDAVNFMFPGGMELVFLTQYTGGALEMKITGIFPDGINGAEIPFKLMGKAGIRDTGDGQFIVNADGTSFSFGRSPLDIERRVLSLRNEAATVSYSAIPDKKPVSPEDFILSRAATTKDFYETVTQWRDQNFSLWNRTVSEQNNEDLVIAFGGEAIVRGTYKAAVASVSQNFLRGTARTYESSVYLGNLDQAYRSLTTRDREKLARLSRQINEKSLEFLLEPRVFEYFAVRGHANFVDAGSDLVKTIDPATLALDLTPGILEGYIDWKTYRPNNDNPFERLVDQACFVVFESLVMSADRSKVFAFMGNQGETEFNLRLGKALLVYAEDVQNSTWAGIGRSLILSALSLSDASGEVKAGLVLSENGETVENTSQGGLTSARLHRILNPVDVYPRAVPVNASAGSIWTWTAAQAVSAVQQNDVLEITVNFPAGETHYMLIRGIRPFAKIQLYNMDFRSDPQFERYDSSGWVYYAPEQVLVLKMRHRTAEERVRIIYREEPAAAPAAQPSPSPAAVQTPAPPPVTAPPPAAVPPSPSPPPVMGNNSDVY